MIDMRRLRTLAATAALTALTGVVLLPAHAHSRYGGSSYEGKPALTVTASLVQAGGGAAHFSTAKALTSMVGSKLVNAEVAKLTKQYGKAKVASWLQIGDFAVKDALRITTKAGVKLPKGNLSGKQLASTLVKAGLEKNGTFNIELLLDKAVTHNIHVQVMNDIDKKFGGGVDANYHKISNQAFYDLAHALGAKSVKLSKFH
jgi:hypothetical protein